MPLRRRNSRISAKDRQLLTLALITLSAGGCGTSQGWRPKIKVNGASRQPPQSASDAVSPEEKTVRSIPPTPVKIRAIGFRSTDIQNAPSEPNRPGEQDPGGPPVVDQAEPIESTFNRTASELPTPVTISEQETVDAVRSVEHFVQLALTGHPSIRAARQRVSAELNRVPQARALPDPKFNNTFWPIHDQSLQTAAGRVGNQMSLSQAIPWPEKLQTQASIVTQEVQVARAEVERVEREVTESVRLAYYELWFATRAIVIVDETKDLIQDLTSVAQARYRSGGSQQDVLRAQLESDRLDDKLVKLQQLKRTAQADLAALVQQPISLLPEATDNLSLDDDTAQLDQLLNLAEQCNPELKGIAWEIQRDQQKQQLACLQKYPDLQVGMSWGLVNDNQNAISPVANGHDQFNFNIGTTLPIWRDKLDAGVREAANRTSSSVKRLDAERDALYGQIRRLLAQADALTEQREIYQTRIIPRTEDTLKLSIADYRGKRTDFFSLIETYRELLMYETQLARIEASIAGTLARIERAVGCPPL